jgi:arabinoxylan arabinofuranohydrolase
MSKGKKSLLGVTLLTASMLASSAVSLPSSAAESTDSYYVYDNFESDTGNWTGRGGAAVEKNLLASYEGRSSLYCSGRTASWNGASTELDSTTFKA